MLVQHFGWQAALRTMGLLVVAIALPAPFFAKDAPQSKENRAASDLAKSPDAFLTMPFFHRSGQWYPAKAKVVLEFGSSFYAEPGHECLVAGIGLQHRRAFAYGLVGRLFSQEACHVIDLLVGRGCHSSIACEALASSHVHVRRSVRDWARR